MIAEDNGALVRRSIEQIWNRGDLAVAAGWSGRGTDSEDHWWGTPASGNVVTWTAVLISRVADGKIAEKWLLWDRLGLWQQLAVAPPTPLLIAPGAASSHASAA